MPYGDEASLWAGYSEDHAPCFGAGSGVVMAAAASGAAVAVGVGASMAARGLSKALRSEAMESKLGDQWSAAGQLLLTYTAAAHWFHDGVGTIWDDLVEHDDRLAGGAFLGARGIKRRAGAEPDARVVAVITVAAFHTLLVLLGFAAGNTLKHMRSYSKRVAIGAAILLMWSLVCYVAALDGITNGTGGVRWLAGSLGWPVDAASAEHFAFVSCTSTALWVAVPMAMAALDREDTGIAPRVVVQYLKYVLGFYAGAVVLFRYLAVPVWDLLARHSVLMPDGGAAPARVHAIDSLAFTKLAATTHTLSLVAGVVFCSVLLRTASFMRSYPTPTLLSLTAAFAFVMAQWISYAFAARVEHVTGIAAYFAGPEAVEAAAGECWSNLHTLVLGSYVAWFAGGVLFEQTWAGAASRPREQRTEEATLIQNTVSLPVFVAVVLCLAIPAGWLAGAVGLATVALLLRPHPSAPLRIPKTPADAYRHVSWEKATADCPATGEHYLVIGVGFVGVRMVKRLLERGEKRIRCFDIAPKNPFEGDERVEYVRGNVCKIEDLQRAMAGIDCVYSVFAIIRFFERLDWQGDLSYNINVKGIENVIKAAQDNGVKRLIQTSTSHVMATPCLNSEVMDENSPYVSRYANKATGQTERSHNHYSWTKALAEQRVRAANGVKGMQTVSVRPCSGVYGFQDRTSTDLMRVRFPLAGVQPAAKFDWVYVDNVVLGHLKAEARLREGAEGVAGEAFNIGNDEPVTYQDVVYAMQFYGDYSFTFRIPLPGALLDGMAVVVEKLQDVTRGRCNGLLSKAALDMVTPACFATSGMSFAVCPKKSKKYLNYTPCWSFDEGIQQTLAFWREHDEKQRQ
eukprot:TRINITY_DN498_c0_g1_i1.p1 TRINITY_DN498_c0_g1~~TRINITY_DN498_c0_g1_i1.p1  ORF type:complete len:853 (+),score=333.84 TRINITY_DN498_c0_g1_i1:75-2633(+)